MTAPLFYEVRGAVAIYTAQRSKRFSLPAFLSYEDQACVASCLFHFLSRFHAYPKTLQVAGATWLTLTLPVEAHRPDVTSPSGRLRAPCDSALTVDPCGPTCGRVLPDRPFQLLWKPSCLVDP